MLFEVLGRQVAVEPRLVICAAFTGRQRETVMQHLREVAHLGVKLPDRVPSFFAVTPDLLTQSPEIIVQGDRTSGEIEMALWKSGGELFVSLCSDHTDRDLESYSIPKSKQVCPKVISTWALPLNQCQEIWDDIVIRASVCEDGEWQVYQQGAMALLLGPAALLQELGRDLNDGEFLFGGTIPTTRGFISWSPDYRLEAILPDGRVLSHNYRVVHIPESL